MNAETIIQFWFDELTAEDWWKKNPVLDQMITQRFTDIHQQATNCELYHWRSTDSGRLAEIIILDQFSRNIFRDTPQAFQYDPIALTLAQEAINQKSDQRLPIQQRLFLYMPYMHSESKIIHQQAIALFSQPGMENNLDYEQQHKTIIDRFGRYPHRNSILNRQSSAEELAFLQQPGSSF